MDAGVPSGQLDAGRVPARNSHRPRTWLVLMIRTVSLMLLITVASLLESSCFLRSLSGSPSEPVAPTQGYESLANFPFKEAWYGTYLQDDKISYSHMKIEPSGENFTVSHEAFMRLTAMKKTNEIDVKDKIVVRPDLSMISFEYDERRNDKRMHMTGKTQGDTFVVEVTVGSEKLRREYPVENKIYHPSTAGLMPALKGLREGAVNTFSMFKPEELRIEQAEQLVVQVKGDPGPQGAIWKVKNNFGKTEVTSWLDKKGQVVIEKALDGKLITVLEDEAAARKFAEKKTPTKDLALDFSLIRIPKPLPNPEKLRFLRAKMNGIDRSLIPQDQRQKTSPASNSPAEGFEVIVVVEDVTPSKPAASAQVSSDDGPPSNEYLVDTAAIQSSHPEIVNQASRIVGSGDSTREKISKLARWTATNIASTMQDSFTSLDVLHNKEGECQSHANLYTALARSQKIPTRVVTGIVYTDKIGFLYHAWAESYDAGWLAVDPTFNQIPADATHIKIFTGGPSDNKHTLFQVMGKVKMEVLDYR